MLRNLKFNPYDIMNDTHTETEAVDIDAIADKCVPPVTDCDTPTLELTPEVEPETVKLGDAYDECLLGATMRGNYAYSLKRMIEFECRNTRMGWDEAREKLAREIVAIMREHGALSPEFIDDELMVEPIRIIRPDELKG